MKPVKSERARIICLANSWKRGARCIAGIELATGRWVRPVTDSDDGGVPDHIRKLRKREPAILDILDIPLAHTGPDFGFECENRLILPGRWYLSGHAQPADLRRYVSDEPHLLHNAAPWVALPYMHSLPHAARHTLQLVETTAMRTQRSRRRQGHDTVWIGTLITTTGQRLQANITDPAFTARLNLGHQPDQHCLVTVSLSMPWRPADRPNDEERCWKLIAGVIELETSRAISAEELAAVPF
jgi:hypothetical protein